MKRDWFLVGAIAFIGALAVIALVIALADPR